MYVKKRSNSERYYLARRVRENGKQKEEEIICSLGEQKPTFTTPDLRNGLCENELPDIPDATRIDRWTTIPMCVPSPCHNARRRHGVL